MTTETVTCPKCGHDNASDAQECAKCGITFEIYLETKENAKSPPPPQKKKAAPAAIPKDAIICPKCSHPNSALSLDCLKCGIVFTKYFESMEMELEADPEKATELQQLRAARDEMAALKKRKEEEAEQEALRKQQEEQERIEALKRERQAELRRQEEQERRRQEEAKRIEAERERKRLEEIERQKAEAEQKRIEEIERQKAEAEQKRIEEIERQKAEAEQKRLDELERQKTEEEQKRLEDIERQKAEEELRRQEEIERQKAEEEQQRLAELEKQRSVEEAETQRQERRTELMKPKGSLKKLLKTYGDQVVGMNCDAPTVYKPARLVSIGDDHFSVHLETEDLVYTYPMGSILSLIEGVEGVPTTAGREKSVYPLVIRVSHRVV